MEHNWIVFKKIHIFFIWFKTLFLKKFFCNHVCHESKKHSGKTFVLLWIIRICNKKYRFPFEITKYHLHAPKDQDVGGFIFGVLIFPLRKNFYCETFLRFDNGSRWKTHLLYWVLIVNSKNEKLQFNWTLKSRGKNCDVWFLNLQLNLQSYPQNYKTRWFSLFEPLIIFQK